MKISTFVQAKGDRPSLVECHEKYTLATWMIPCDEVWISCVFKWNKDTALSYKKAFEKSGVPVHIGGSGVDIMIKLPDEIEILNPDYTLYQDKKGKLDDRAIGFIQRGCIRKCDFCDVSKKEGRLVDNPYRSLESWVPEGFSKVMLLDNEFAALPYD